MEGHGAQVSSPEPPQLAKEGCSLLEQGNQGTRQSGNQESRSKLLLFVTMTPEKTGY